MITTTVQNRSRRSLEQEGAKPRLWARPARKPRRGWRPQAEFLEGRELLNSVVSVATEMAHASEIGPTPGIFRFTRTGDLNTPLSASFKLAGTATSGTDYLLLDNMAQFEAGSDSAFVTILPRNDGGGEGDESVALTLLPGTGYTLSTTTTSATVTIDRDALPAALGIYDSADSVQPDITYLDAQILNGQLRVSISLKNVSPFSFSNVEVFVDADQNPATGDYRTGHVGGAEYRLSATAGILNDVTVWKLPTSPNQADEVQVGYHSAVAGQHPDLDGPGLGTRQPGGGKPFRLHPR